MMNKDVMQFFDVYRDYQALAETLPESRLLHLANERFLSVLLANIEGQGGEREGEARAAPARPVSFLTSPDL